ncbi:MAG: glycoside hydrolase family 38 C-terminal domain-containing protein [Acidimicrobiales bacterium]
MIEERTHELEPETPHLPMHLIGNAHMDPVWIWDWREGFGEVWATFRSALDRLEESPALTFTASSAAYYSWIEAHDPAMFDEIRRAVDDGRWSVVGGMWIEPDCNMPSGESLARQLLLGQRYFQRVFGRPARVGYNVDSFGHAAGLANLLFQGGLHSYVFMRPEESERQLSSHAFLWDDPGGHAVVAYRIPMNYETESLEFLLEKVETLTALGDEERTPQMCFFGIGNHGGGPTKRMVAALDELRATRTHLHYSDPEEYFSALRAAEPALPTVSGELQHHAVGCYSVSAWVKAANRRGEIALQDAETFDAIAAVMLRRSAASSVLGQAWEQLALCQFHDILAGTSSTQAYRSVRSRYGYVETIADEVTTNATYQLSHHIDTRVEVIRAQERESFWAAQPGAAAPFVVFNPLAWPVHLTIRAPRHAARVLDSAGRELPSQQVASGEATAYRTHTLFSLGLDPLGYEVVWLQGGSGRINDEDFTATSELRNEHYRVSVDPSTGALTSLFDVAESRELVGAGGIRLTLQRDASDTWSHGVVRYDDDELPLAFEGSELIEDGPLRSTLRLRYRHGDSRVLEDIVLESSPARIKVHLRATWSLARCVLKLVLPWNLAGQVTTSAGAAYSFQDRAPNGAEEPFQAWLDVYDAANDVGIGLATPHLYGYDASGPTVRLTVLRNAIAADHGRTWTHRIGEDFELTDSGDHDVTVALIPHRGDWRAAQMPKVAEELARPVTVIAETYHDGTLPGRGAFLEIDPPDCAVVRSIKRAESGDGVVLRLVEPVGNTVSVRLSGTLLQRAVAVNLAPYEVMTLLVPDDLDQEARRVTLAELEFDTGGEE